MLTPLTQRYIGALVLLLGTAVCTGAWAQTPTPTPSGEFLCSAGPQDGQACNSDADCAPTGVCVIAPGICNGGTSDAAYCDCIAGSCTASTPACDPTYTGVCDGGLNATWCCDVATNCAGGAPCVGTQKVCLGGTYKGFSCLNDDQCPGSVCQSTGKYCSGGDFDSVACVDDVDCNNVDGSPGGTCTGAGPQPTPTPTPPAGGCTGDCDGSGDVTVNELITMVNIALGNTAVAVCPIGDADASGDITINEIIAAVNNALDGCAIATPTQTPSGEFLCSAGPRDGQACNSDGDCAPTGVCVIAQGICDGGIDDGFPCDCAAGSCTASTPACDPTFTGVCQGGPNATACCDVATNCAGGNACVGTQKVCLGGTFKGYSCLRDAECSGSTCESTGRFCNGGDYSDYACVDASDCLNVDGSTGGTCDAVVAAALTQAPADSANACVITDQCPA